MLEFSILLFVVLSIVWLMEMADVGPSIKTATVEQAWRIVLDDPHYAQRLQYEEHKRAEETRLRKEAERL